MRRGVLALAGTILVSALATTAAATAAPHPHSAGDQSVTPAGETVATIRDATDPFHNIVRAEAAGYASFQDIHGISCIAMQGMGGMGVHFVNGDLVGDPKIDRSHPEALVYAPDRDGTLRLAAVEYIVVKADWDATHASAPQLMGRDFNLTASPNRFGLPDFYSLHVWAWQVNSAGVTAMWNPDVHCSWA